MLPDPLDHDSIVTAVYGSDVTVECPLRFGSLRLEYDVGWLVDGETIVNDTATRYLILREPEELLTTSTITMNSDVQCRATLFGLSPRLGTLISIRPHGE